MSGPELGIVIPHQAPSRLPWLERAVESVLGQRDPRWRLWISDDSAGKEASRRWEASGDGRIRVLAAPPGLGLAGHFNRCLGVADTELVTLLHDDDLLRPGYVEGMRREAERDPEATAYFCAVTAIDAGGEEIFSLADRVKDLFWPGGQGSVALEGERGAELLARCNIVPCPSVCFRKKKLGSRGFDPSMRYLFDVKLFFSLMLGGDRMVGLRQAEYAYRRHAGTATSQATESGARFDEELALYDWFAAQCEGRGWRGASASSRRRVLVRLHMAHSMLGLARRGRWREAGERAMRLASDVAARRGHG